MKSKLILVLFIILFSQITFSYQWEIGLEIRDQYGQFVVTEVLLYKDQGIFYELYRHAFSGNIDLGDNANLVFDVDDARSTTAAWDPVESGQYFLRIGDKYIFLNIPTCTWCNEDAVIKYQNEEFSVYPNQRNVTIGATNNWDRITVTFEQQEIGNNIKIGVVAIGQNQHFSDSYVPPMQFYVVKNNNYLFQADTMIIDSKKFNNWDDITEVINFREKYISEYPIDIVSLFNYTNSSIKIKNEFTEYTQLDPNNDIVEFSDPWLIDFEDPNHYNFRRNQRMGAPLIERDSPFYPDYTTCYDGNTYKGVFLEQGWPGWDPPYYSVKAVSPQDIDLGGSLGTHRFYFLNWGGTDVTFDNANADETAVVFHSSDAVVNAKLKGTQLSNDVDAFNTNSQRKFVKSDDGYLHKVYQSIGHVWYEISPDNGQTWEIMNGGKPLDNGEGKLPAID